MKITVAQRATISVFLVLFGGALSPAKRPDQSLLSLVPPDSQIVAGAAAPLDDPNRGNFLVFTRANILDLADFFSIVGVDASRKIYQMIFAASARASAANPEHSVLVSGDFDPKRIYAAAESTSGIRDYHGIKVAVLHPFEREGAFLRQDRWLAIIDSRLAIFGTVSSAQQEIDRFLNGVAADTSIVRMLSSLRSADDTWCFISSLDFGAEIPQILKRLDPAFADIDRNGDSILFGIRYSRRIEFEYIVSALPEVDPVPNPAVQTSFHPADRGLASLQDSGLTPGSGVRHVVKISRSRYERWLADLRVH